MKKINFLFAFVALIFVSATAQDNGKWVDLFDGKTFTGWRGYNSTTIPPVWTIDNGTIKINKAAEGQTGRRKGGDLIFDKKFKNFELELEWKVAKGSNSGIFYLGQEIKTLPLYTSAPEYQVLDNQNHPDGTAGKNGNHQSASLYDMIPAVPQNALPFDQWNKTKIVVNNGKVQHYQNDVLVVEYELWTDKWKEMLENSKFSSKAWPEAYKLLINCGGDNHDGYIGLQDHGDDVWFRNIRIKEL
ncbi:MAG: DUF1080 domain-containing protein [Bacteroidales bacterium]